LDVI
jgi:hypothetical protein